MRKYLLFVVVLVALFFALLPHQATQASAKQKVWFVWFTYDIPADTWTEGVHNYTYAFTWTDPSHGSSQDEGSFIINGEAPLYKGKVLLRGPFGNVARLSGATCTSIEKINPAQDTRFHIGWASDYPMTPQEAKTYFAGLSATVAWDGGAPVTLTQHEVTPIRNDMPKTVCLWTTKK